MGRWLDQRAGTEAHPTTEEPRSGKLGSQAELGNQVKQVLGDAQMLMSTAEVRRCTLTLN